MPQEEKTNSLGNFSDLDDEILIKQDGSFKIFSHGSLKDFNIGIREEPSTAVLDTGLEERILPPPPPMIFDKKGADFYFDIDDKDEIIKQKQKIDKLEPKIKQYSLRKIVERVLESNQIELIPQLETKFYNIVFSFLKHTREKLDVEEIFTKKIIDLGLGFEKKKAESVLKLLTEIRDKIDEIHGTILNDLNAEDFVTKTESQNKEHLSNLDPRQQIQVKPINTNIPFIKRTTTASSSTKQVMNDVKQKPKTISPVEELGEININVFRRISNNPVESTQRILNMINAFGKESILKKAAAIKNWRKSEIYRIYLMLGRESIEKSLSVSKIIEQKAIANEKTITLEEFQAISDLNKKIKF
ncbi:MAG: hypothetical protein PHH83_04825 [Patescibacteria group bacterium]|nr:hypothetical protein [Patescibacteria group bacterium]